MHRYKDRQELLFKPQGGAGKMAPWVRVLATKSDHLTMVPEHSHNGKKRTISCKLSLPEPSICRLASLAGQEDLGVSLSPAPPPGILLHLVVLYTCAGDWTQVLLLVQRALS